jgi:hypothetical protein
MENRGYMTITKEKFEETLKTYQEMMKKEIKEMI